MSKKIGLVLSYMPGYSETFFKSKIKGLLNNGHDLTIYVDYPPTTKGHKDIKLVVAPNLNHPRKKYFNAIIALFKCIFLTPVRSYTLFKLNAKSGMPLQENMVNLLKNQFLLNHRLDWIHFGFGMLAVGREHIAEVLGPKMGVSFRGYDLYLSPLKHPGCYDILFKRDVYYHVLSKGMRKTLMDYGISVDRISIIPPAIDTDYFTSSTESSNTNALQIITIARLHWKKGLEYSIQAMFHLKEMGVNFHYSIIGEGEEMERLAYSIHQFGLERQVTLIGKLERDKVKKALKSSDIYVQYSIQEGFCNAVLEAQSMGLLCIVSKAEGLDENVLDTETGWVIEKRNPLMLAKTIMKVNALSSERKFQIRKNAIQRVKDNFNINQQQNAFNQFFD